MKPLLKTVAVSLGIIFIHALGFASESVRKNFHASPSGEFNTLGVTNSLQVGLSPAEAPQQQAGLGEMNLATGYVYWANVNVENDFIVGDGTKLKVVQGSDYSGALVNERRVGIGLAPNERPYEALDVRGDWSMGGLYIADEDMHDSDECILILDSYGNQSLPGPPRFPSIKSVEAITPDAGEVHYRPLFLKGSPHIILNHRRYLENPSLVSDGNVGIGVMLPDASVKLDVAGNIMTHNYDATSSRAMKTDIQPLSASEYKSMYATAGKINMARYHYKNEHANLTPHLGVIAEETPEALLSNDKKSLSLTDEIGFLIAVIKQLTQENREIENQIAQLERKYLPEVKNAI